MFPPSLVVSLQRFWFWDAGVDFKDLGLFLMYLKANLCRGGSQHCGLILHLMLAVRKQRQVICKVCGTCACVNDYSIACEQVLISAGGCTFLGPWEDWRRAEGGGGTFQKKFLRHKGSYRVGKNLLTSRRDYFGAQS